MVRKPAQVTVRTGGQRAPAVGDQSHRLAVVATALVALIGGWLLWSVISALEPAEAPASQAAPRTLNSGLTNPLSPTDAGEAAHPYSRPVGVPHPTEASALLAHSTQNGSGICSVPDESRLVIEWVWADGGLASVTAENGESLLLGDETRWRDYPQVCSSDRLPGGLISIDGLRLPSPPDDAELAHCLSVAPRLSRLAVSAELLTDRGLACLRQCTELLELELAHATLSAGSLEHVAAAPALRGLSLVGANLQADALRPLSRCQELRYLSLEGVAFAQGNLHHLESLRQLQRLDLRRSDVDEQSLETLVRLKPLRRLDIGATSISSAGLQRLQQALPQCAVCSDGAIDHSQQAWPELELAGAP